MLWCNKINFFLRTDFFFFYFRLLFKLFTNPFKVHREVIKRKLTPVLEKRLNDMKRDGESYVPPVDILQKLIELVIEDDYKADIDIITDYVITAIFAATHTTSTFLTNATHSKYFLLKYVCKCMEM